MDRTGNQEQTIQRYRQHNGQDGQSRIDNPKIPATQWTGWAIKNRQSKETGNTMDRTGNQEQTIQKYRQHNGQDEVNQNKTAQYNTENQKDEQQTSPKTEDEHRSSLRVMQSNMNPE